MKHRVPIAVALLMASLRAVGAGELATAPPGAAQWEQGTRYALVVGVSEYKGAHVKPVPSAAKDAAALAQLLRYHGRTPYDVTLLRDRNATRGNVVGLLNGIVAKAGPEDSILVFFAGHGVVWKGYSWLVPHDATTSVKESCLPVAALTLILGKAKARQSVVVLDSCHAGASADAAGQLGSSGAPQAPPRDELGRLQSERLFVLSSCQPGEAALADQASGHGYFAKHLLAALRGNADGYGPTSSRDGFITASEAAGYVLRTANAEAGAEHTGKTQRAQTGGEPPGPRFLSSVRPRKLDTIVLIRPGEKVVVERPQPQRGQMRVDLRIPDTGLRLDGQDVPIGRGPKEFLLRDVDPGRHTLQVTKEGCTPAELPVDVKAGETTTVVIDEMIVLVPLTPAEPPPPAEPPEPGGPPKPAAPEVSSKGRQKRAVEAIGRKDGTTKEAEDAVKKGLMWLARVQEKDGRWNARFWDGRDYDVGVSGLALLAFLGHGYTDTAGPYKDHVARAINWLMAQQMRNGRFRSETFYEHGIATMALCEAYAMTQSPKVRDAAQKAIDHLTSTQPEHGGFRYEGAVRKSEGDMSVTGWQIMAVKSAEGGKLKVPEQAAERFRTFLKNAYRGEGKSAYLAGGRAGGPGIWAIGMYGRQLLGQSESEEARAAADALLAHAKAVAGNHTKAKDHFVGDLYFTYYSTLAMFQLGGEAWKEWNRMFRDPLVDVQDLRRFDERNRDVLGSWDPTRHHWAEAGGRVYSTAMAILALEVYYRFLPLYRTKQAGVGDSQP